MCGPLRLGWIAGVLFAGLMVWPLPVAVAEDAAGAGLQLRVLCYNIHHGRGTDGKVDLERIAAVIRRVNPDLVALQEVDRGTRRTGGVDQTAELARLTGLHGKFAKQIDYEGGEYGQAILSRFPLPEPTVHWLPGDPKREQRIVGLVELIVVGQRLIFATTHLHHADGAIRLEQARALSALFADRPHPVILAGDLNAVPGSPPLAELAQQWHVAQPSGDQPAENLATFPAAMPTRQLDYVLATPRSAVRIQSAQVLDEPVASDHRPLLVVLQLVPGS